MKNRTMNYKLQFSKIAVFTQLFLFLFLFSCQNEKDNTKYNVLFIAVDDMRTELNCYGADYIKSPNIDKLASNGVMFTKAYVQEAICMATRASIMTGLRPESKGIYTGESVQDLVPDVLTLNKLFEQNNYTISAFGKIYHYGSDHKIQFGDRYSDPKEKWAGRGYLTDEAIEEMYFNENHPIKGRSHADRGPAFEHADVADSAYIDGYNTEMAIRKLKSLKNEKNPFFMAIGFHKPHLPFIAPKKYWDLYPIETVSLPEIKDKPENATPYTLRSWGELRNYYGMPKHNEPVGEDTTRILRQGYFACVSYVDAQIGKIIETLKELDLDKNTIIVLWGDHGYKLGDYGYWAKWSNMNIDTHIPLIFNVPGGEKNARCNVPVEALDIYPTLADLCGFQKPEHLEGKSILPLLNKPETNEDDYAYSVWPHDRAKYEKTVMGYAVKTSQYNYVEWVKLSSGEVLASELYDHKIDPMETRNVIDDNNYTEVINRLSAKCKERQKATDKTGPITKKEESAED